jgi:N-acetylglutamate synthase-like GNAT family acetyltransferase
MQTVQSPIMTESPQISVRPLNNLDCAAIIDLVLPIQQDEFQVAITLEDQPDLLDIESAYIAGGGNFWGAFDGDLLIGTIALLKAEEQMAALRKMFVRQSYRGKTHGVAKALLKILEDDCREKGITNLYLGTVPQLKAAHRFYERNGFTQLAAEDLPSAFPRMAADKIFYFIHISKFHAS